MSRIMTNKRDTRFDSTPDEPFEVWQCQTCGVAQTHPFPSNIEDYYPSQYYSARTTHEESGVGYLLRRCLKSIRSQLGISSLLPSSPGRLLVVGPGPGHKLSEYRDQGWKVTGVEPDPNAVMFAREQYGLELLQGTLVSCADQLPSDSFDVVLLDHVFEHIPNPHETLEVVRDVLKEGKHLVIEVPNYASWNRRWLGEAWGDLDVPRHLFHYTPETMQMLLDGHGFELEQYSYNGSPVLPAWWLAKAILSKLPISFSPNMLRPLLIPLATPWALCSSLAGGTRFRHRYRLEAKD